MALLTQQELQLHIHYDAVSGVFTRLKGKGAGTTINGINKCKQYQYIRVLGTRYMAHRLAWLYIHGKWPISDIDHINRIKYDNRISNLREVTKSENQYNRGLSTNSSTGAKGVYKTKYGYIAQITINSKPIYLGTYSTVDEASSAYVKASKERHKSINEEL